MPMNHVTITVQGNNKKIMHNCPFQLRTLIFMAPLTHMDSSSAHGLNPLSWGLYIYIYIVFYSFFNNCPLLIPLHNTAVLIKICRF